MKGLSDLQRALLLSAAVVLALGALVFWPSQRSAAPRPGIQAPVVFDELVLSPESATDSGKNTGRR